MDKQTVISRKWNIFSAKKKWANEKTEGNLKAHYPVKEANLERLHTVWFQLDDILEMAKLLDSKTISVARC